MVVVWPVSERFVRSCQGEGYSFKDLLVGYFLKKVMLQYLSPGDLIQLIIGAFIN
jgi:hypothetical protein